MKKYLNQEGGMEVVEKLSKDILVKLLKNIRLYPANQIP